MLLIGQYDSPFVRRVAVTMNVYGLNFDRRVLSVFTDFEAVLAINPLGKVPILKLANGEYLFDSRAILDHLDTLSEADRRLVPSSGPERRVVLRIEAIALGLAEKLYERGYEFARRDPSKRDAAVVARIERQITSALTWLEAREPSPWLVGDRMTRADVTAAIAYTYLLKKQPQIVQGRKCSTLKVHCSHCEALAPFKLAAYSEAEATRSGWRPEA